MSKFSIRFKQLRRDKGLSQQALANLLGFSKSSVNMYERGEREPGLDSLERIADFFNVDMDYLLGKSEISNKTQHPYFPAPNITDDYVTFPIIGDIAAGYNNIADESWNGETIDIPKKYLRNIERENFFVLKVKGNSMYPLYHEGDMVLIRRQTTLNRSGEIGAVLYDDECATLKKVEYVQGEDWLELLPVNPEYPPERIEGKRLEHCRIIGVPYLLIREFNKDNK